MASLAPRLGFDAADTDVLVAMVRHHLLLPDTATRRDLDDPATVAAVAAAVGDADALDLLYALAVADAAATGPAAWSDWKAGLVADLVGRTHAALAGRPAPAPPRLTSAQRLLAETGGVEVLAEPDGPLVHGHRRGQGPGRPARDRGRRPRGAPARGALGARPRPSGTGP